jgi:hypothetical protein
MPDPPIWSRQSLVSGMLAAVVCAGTDWHLDVQSGEIRFRVPESLLGDFLIRHADRRFACHHAGEFHGALERTLGKHEPAAKAVLWALSRDGRLIDLSLLAILVRHARQWSPHERSEATEPQLIEPSALLTRTEELLQQASEISRSLNGADIAKGFGPLGLALEVQARIAAFRMSGADLRLCSGARDALQRACEARCAVLDKILRQDRAARRILKPSAQRHGGAAGLPIRQSNKLKDWLLKIRSSLFDTDGIPIAAPESQRYQDWRDFANAHPLVGA